MPKVSEAHREQRREEILEAAWEVFSRNGFHSSTMAQVIGASGLSAGAVYLYFRSKEDLIAATAGKALGAARAVTQQILAENRAVSPGEAVLRLLDGFTGVDAGTEGRLFPIALQAWAEAARNPAIGAIAHQVFTTLIGEFATIVQRWADAGNPIAAPPADCARMIGGIIQGYILQIAAFGAPDTKAYRRLLADRTTAMLSA